MVKAYFQRTKPHVNLSTARQKLRQIGVSEIGVQQLLNEQPLSIPTDRKLLAQIAVQATSGYGLPGGHTASALQSSSVPGGGVSFPDRGEG